MMGQTTTVVERTRVLLAAMLAAMLAALMAASGVAFAVSKESRKMRGAAWRKTRGWVLAATATAILLAAVASGEDQDPCSTAYLASGLPPQQVSFEEFGELYGDGLCAAPPGTVAHKG